jgi:hypothetical protein
MIGRRSMSATLGEIAEGVMAATAGTGIRATQIELDLPLDIVWTGSDFTADLPSRVTRTSFDPPPSRLRMVWEAQP